MIKSYLKSGILKGSRPKYYLSIINSALSIKPLTYRSTITHEKMQNKNNQKQMTRNN